MIEDLKYLIYSYLDLEQILITFKDNVKLKNKIISRNYKTLPDVDEACITGKLETVKYLCEHVQYPRKNTLFMVCEYGYLEILEYLISLGFLFSYMHIDKASLFGHLEVVKYLFEVGILQARSGLVYYETVKPTFNTIKFAYNSGHLDIVKYLLDQNIEYTLNKVYGDNIDQYPEIQKYLKDKNMQYKIKESDVFY